MNQLRYRLVRYKASRSERYLTQGLIVEHDGDHYFAAPNAATDSVARPPLPENPSRLSALRAQPTVGRPEASTCPAIAVPILPSPTMPTNVLFVITQSAGDRLAHCQLITTFPKCDPLRRCSTA